MSLFVVVLCAALAASWLYHLAAVLAARDWCRATASRSKAETRHRVSVLKPLHGDEPGLAENLRSFLRQDYPEYETVFGALDPADPALEVADRVAAGDGAVRVRRVSGDASAGGLNRKACTLALMMPYATGDVLVLADSDMRVAPNYLREVTAPLANPSVGVVTCLYRALDAPGLAAALEALGIGADFAPSALVARAREGMRFAFGSTIAVRREVLEQIGGFERLRNDLADDYLVGYLAHRAGWRVELAGAVVDTVLGRETLGAMWARRVRWARTVRAMRPAGYAGSGLTQATALACLLVAASSAAPWSVAALAGTVALRMAAVGLITGRYTRDRAALRLLWLLPISDLVSAAVWVAGFCGRTILWRGQRLRVLAGGRLAPVARQPERGSG